MGSHITQRQVSIAHSDNVYLLMSRQWKCICSQNIPVCHTHKQCFWNIKNQDITSKAEYFNLNQNKESKLSFYRENMHQTNVKNGYKRIEICFRLVRYN